MQYHLNGFRSGDPAVTSHNNEAAKRSDASGQSVDVLIIGCGPAGLTLAAQLCAFADIRIKIVDQKSGPLTVGQADGLACRSLEMFEAFGFAEKVIKEAYGVNQVAFWRPEPDGTGLQRAQLIQDVEDDLSEMPHVILNQARVHDFYLELMHNSSHRLVPAYDHKLIALTRTDAIDYPLTARFDCLNGGSTKTINARYVIGCDGARSTVRQSLQLELKGESARQLWGVMDVLAVTDFPDIRKKAAVQSAEQGSLLVIPREGGYMVRLYIELAELHGEERASVKNVSPELLIDKAQAILFPYKLDVKETVWWSAYEIGQRVCDAFDNLQASDRLHKVPDTFIAGDACHTHSPKAGQGMNVGMADSFNLGWKLAAVLRQQAQPSILNTYSMERQAKARELIDFDRDMARLFSRKPENAAEAEQFQQYFKQHGRYTAGVETHYGDSIIMGVNEHQALAAGLTVGKRFHSDTVLRLSDGLPMQLGHALKADGRWRVLIFANTTDDGQSGQPLASLCEYLAKHPASPVGRYTRKEADIDSLIDIRAVFQLTQSSLALEALPELLLPRKGKYGLIDYEKVFCPDTSSGRDIFDTRKINRDTGALVIVRPDQYVANVLPLADFAGLSGFFDQFLLAP